jgi:hypothetical protein
MPSPSHTTAPHSSDGADPKESVTDGIFASMRACMLPFEQEASSLNEDIARQKSETNRLVFAITKMKTGDLRDPSDPEVMADRLIDIGSAIHRADYRSGSSLFPRSEIIDVISKDMHERSPFPDIDSRNAFYMKSACLIVDKALDVVLNKGDVDTILRLGSSCELLLKIMERSPFAETEESRTTKEGRAILKNKRTEKELVMLELMFCAQFFYGLKDGADDYCNKNGKLREKYYTYDSYKHREHAIMRVQHAGYKPPVNPICRPQNTQQNGDAHIPRVQAISSQKTHIDLPVISLSEAQKIEAMTRMISYISYIHKDSGGRPSTYTASVIMLSIMGADKAEWSNHVPRNGYDMINCLKPMKESGLDPVHLQRIAERMPDPWPHVAAALPDMLRADEADIYKANNALIGAMRKPEILRREIHAIASLNKELHACAMALNEHSS